jgi:hypothetical protein
MEKNLQVTLKNDTKFECDNIREIQNLGEKTLNSNKFFSYLDYLLNDEVCKQFIKEYFSDWDSIKTTMMFIKTYQIIESQFEKLDKQQISKDEKRKLIIGLVKELIDNGASRREIVKNMMNFMNNDWSECNKVCGELVNKLSLE